MACARGSPGRNTDSRKQSCQGGSRVIRFLLLLIWMHNHFTYARRYAEWNRSFCLSTLRDNTLKNRGLSQRNGTLSRPDKGKRSHGTGWFGLGPMAVVCDVTNTARSVRLLTRC